MSAAGAITWEWGQEPVARAVTSVVTQSPLVHCLTNIVVAGFTANVLLAVGASPAMVENAKESASFAAIAGGVLVNLGTLSAEREQAMTTAAAAAHDAGRPWVLDPVAVGALAPRTVLARDLLSCRPAIVRGNASEIMSLAGSGAGGRGVDATATSVQALDAAMRLALTTGAVVAVSGVVDYITDGHVVAEVRGGHPLMARVTGTGCALGALMAALAAAGNTPLTAAAAASVLLKEAGGRAAEKAKGPGTFATEMVDQLYELAETAAGASR